MKILSIAILAIALIFVGCNNKLKKKETTGFSLNQPFQLKMFETVKKSSGSLKLTVTGMPEDSRCPEDANCIWEGQVRVFVDVSTSQKKESLEFKVEKSKMGKVSHVFDKYRITLEAVNPLTQSGIRIAKEDYVVTFKVAMK